MSWGQTLGCTEYPSGSTWIRECYEGYQNGGLVATSGSSTSFSGKPVGTYTYTLRYQSYMLYNFWQPLDSYDVASASVSVLPPPVPTVSASFSPATISEGQSSTLSWSSSHATSCSATGISGVSDTSGSVTYQSPSVLSSNLNTTATVTCTGAGGSGNNSATVQVNWVNDAPTISNIADVSINEDNSSNTIGFAVYDEETSGGALVVSGSSTNQTLVPNGNIIFGGSGNTRTFYITPGANQTGAATITITVTDGSGASASDTFVVYVNGVNDAPVISNITDQAINEDTSTGAIAFTVSDVDKDASLLSVTATSSNTVLIPNSNLVLGGSSDSRTITATPMTNKFGSATITITVSDGTLAAADTFVVTVNSVNDAPTISDITNKTINEDSTTGAVAFTVGDVETAVGSLTVSASSSNATLIPNSNLIFGGSGANRTITATPVANQFGTATISVTVSDGGTPTTDTFVLTVNNVNDAPTISDITNKTINEDSNTGAIAFTVSDLETAAGSLSVSATSSNATLIPNNSSGLALGGSGGNRTITVTPTANNSGTATITVTVSDGSLSATDTFVVTVTAVNDAPTISNITNKTINEDSNTGAITFTVGDLETAAGSLSVTKSSSNTTLIPNSNVVLGGSGANRTITVTPTANNSGSATITVTVSDGALSATDTFVVTVNSVNDTPTISSIGNKTILVNGSTGAISFTVGDVETAAGSLTVTKSSSNTTLIPNGNLILGGSGANRTITATPTANNTGSSTITVTVSDGSLSASRTFVVAVDAVVSPPPSGGSASDYYSGLTQEFNGVVNGSFAVTPSGAATYTIPIQVSPGTGGTTPSLALVYNSQQQEGVMGYGWALAGGPAGVINRCPKTIAQDGQPSTINLEYCFNGNRLVRTTVSGTDSYGSYQEYRTEVDGFQRTRFYSSTNIFRVWSQDGTRYDYGTTADSYLSSAGGQWRNGLIQDAYGNTISITYEEEADQSEARIAEINYGGNTQQGAGHYARVQFNYSTLANVIPKYVRSDLLVIHKKLDGMVVQVKKEGSSSYSTVRTYELAYNYNEVEQPNGIPRLTSIRMCGATPNVCTDQTTFDWQDQNSGFTTSVWTAHDYSAATLFDLIDINGDGRIDLVSSGPANSGEHTVSLSNGNGFDSAQTWYAQPRGNTGFETWTDLNGDGKADYVTTSRVGNNLIHYVSLSSGSNSYLAAQEWVIGQWYWPLAPSEHLFADFNGDGKQDFFVIGGSPEYPYYQVYFSTGSGYQASAGNSGSWWIPFANPYSFNVASNQLVDMDVDGRIDVVLIGQYGSILTEIALNVGNTFDTFDYPGNYRYLNSNISMSGMSWADLNGDNYRDIISLWNGAVSVWKGGPFSCCNETGGFANQTWTVPPISLHTASARSFQDMNGDGLADIIAGGPHYTEFNDGNYYVAFSNGNNFVNATTWTGPTATNVDKIKYNDMNGDGQVDVVSLNSNGQLQVGINNSKPVHLLKGITDGLGNETTITYKPTSDPTVHTKSNNAVYPSADIANSSFVVASVSTDDGLGDTLDSSYRYEGFKVDRHGRGSLGFAKVTAVDEDNFVKTITTYSQTFPTTSLPLTTQTIATDANSDGYPGDEQLISSTTTNYVVRNGVANASGPAIKYVCVNTQTTESYDLDGSWLSTTVSNNDPNNIGAPCDSYGVNAANSTTVTDRTQGNTTHSVLSTQVINHDTSNWFIGQVMSVQVQQSVNGINNAAYNRETAFTYNSKGRVQTVTREPNLSAPIKLTTTLAYDGFGNQSSETITPSDANESARSETVTYDSRGRFPSTLTNAENHSSTLFFNELFGSIKEIRGPNYPTVAATFMEYDDFGRSKKVTRADGTVEDVIYRDVSGGATGIVDRATAAIMVESTVHDLGNTQQFAPVRTYLDNFGRTIRTRTRAFDASNFIHQDVHYDHRGRVEKSSEPYFDNTTPKWSVPNYDVLGRNIGVAAADPTQNSSTDFDDFTVTVTDALGRSRQVVNNAVGQVLRSYDNNSSNAQLSGIKYQYNEAGLLWRTVKLNSANSEITSTATTYEYDRLGRRTSTTDPDAGLITYVYNSLSELEKQQTPKLRAYSSTLYMEMEYDKLGRLTNRWDPTDNLSGIIASTFVFDVGSAAIGQLSSESLSGGGQPSFSRSFTYSGIEGGKLTDIVTTIGAETFTTSTGYDALGRMSRVIYPNSPSHSSGYQVNYSYNPRGYLERVFAGQGSGKVLYQATQVNALGQMVQEYRGDGSTTNNSYHADHHRLMNTTAARPTAGGATQNIQSFGYSYDALGNMNTRSDLLRNITETFAYDQLNRLTSSTVANSGGSTTTNFGFDSNNLGNLTSKSDVGNLFYESTRPHALTRVNVSGVNRSINYDTNGNLTSGDAFGSGRNITWTSFDKPSLITQGSVSRQFYYGPDGSRYRQIHNKGNGTDTITYVGDLYERIDHGGGNVDHKLYVFAGGEAIAILVDDQVTSNAVQERYLHRDHLGSITSIVDSAGIESLSYDAFGRRRDATDWVGAAATAPTESRGYTGHEHLDNVNLIHMNGRIMDPVLGRMASADPILQSPLNAQNYNRYSYVLNNPLKYTDPSGYQTENPFEPKSEDGLFCNNVNTTDTTSCWSQFWGAMASWAMEAGKAEWAKYTNAVVWQYAIENICAGCVQQDVGAVSPVRAVTPMVGGGAASRWKQMSFWEKMAMGHDGYNMEIGDGYYCNYLNCLHETDWEYNNRVIDRQSKLMFTTYGVIFGGVAAWAAAPEIAMFAATRYPGFYGFGVEMAAAEVGFYGVGTYTVTTKVVVPTYKELVGLVRGFQAHHILPRYLGKMLGYTTEQMADHPATLISQWAHVGKLNPDAFHKVIRKYLPEKLGPGAPKYTPEQIRTNLKAAYEELGRPDLYNSIDHLIK